VNVGFLRVLQTVYDRSRLRGDHEEGACEDVGDEEVERRRHSEGDYEVEGGDDGGEGEVERTQTHPHPAGHRPRWAFLAYRFTPNREWLI
jgi:hypothetical protein